jgi:hypothetical protein
MQGRAHIQIQDSAIQDSEAAVDLTAGSPAIDCVYDAPLSMPPQHLSFNLNADISTRP